MVEALHKTCNIKHEIDIKRYGNVKSETDSCQCFCFGFFFLLFFLNLPFADGSLGAIKADTHFYQSLTFRMIRQHIALFIYLSQSLIGTLINLQFKDVDCIRHVHHGISSADGALHLCADIDVEEAEHQIEDSLIMLLAVILQIVWYF